MLEQDQNQLFEKIKRLIRDDIARADSHGRLAAELAAWEAGLFGHVPRTFACYVAKARSMSDPEWIEYLRLRKKLELGDA